MRCKAQTTAISKVSRGFATPQRARQDVPKTVIFNGEGYIADKPVGSQIGNSPAVEQKRIALFQVVLTGNQEKTEALLSENPALIHFKTSGGNKSLLQIAAAKWFRNNMYVLIRKWS